MTHFAPFCLWLLRSPLCYPERQLWRRSKDENTSKFWIPFLQDHSSGRMGSLLPCQLCTGEVGSPALYNPAQDHRQAPAQWTPELFFLIWLWEWWYSVSCRASTLVMTTRLFSTSLEPDLKGSSNVISPGATYYPYLGRISTPPQIPKCLIATPYYLSFICSTNISCTPILDLRIQKWKGWLLSSGNGTNFNK